MLTLILLTALAAAPPTAVPDADAIATLLDATADELNESLAPEGRGYDYHTYGSDELRYAVGDLDGDGVPEIAARGIYFMGVGSYDLIDIFADAGDGYRRVDFLNLYHLALEDEVESVEIRDGRLHLVTVGFQRGQTLRKCAEVTWRAPQGVSVEHVSCKPS